MFLLVSVYVCLSATLLNKKLSYRREACDIDIAILSVCLSVRLSVCLSVTFRY